ncbi:MAG: RNA-binding S4 domain-containing protein [Oscillospiraceae bacterium]|nr:RNA-binding S4 domain-containing protein [Oscillospiraceae bacterium]
MEQIKIQTENIKLCQFLKFCSISQTGGNANELIKSGAIYVNNQQCLMRNKKLKNHDTIQYGNKTFEVVVNDNN